MKRVVFLSVFVHLNGSLVSSFLLLLLLVYYFCLIAANQQQQRGAASDMMASPHPLFRFLSFLILTILSLAPPILSAVKSTMSVGDTLSTTDPPLQSPSGDFSFGFHPVSHHESSSSYLPSIWYTSIPDTIVWYAVGGPIVPKGSQLELTAGGGVVIRNPQGEEQWRPPLSQGTVNRCTLNDTGNFIIWSTDGETMWQSFDHPRDTLLPTQTLSNDGGVAVDSMRTEFNYSSGRFRMMLSGGDLILTTRDPDTDNTFDVNYFTSDTAKSGELLRYNKSGHMYVVKNDSTSLELTAADKVPKPATDYYFRATLSFDGVFAWYYHEKSNNNDTIRGKKSNWTMINLIPDNICTITSNIDSGACGFNSICTLGNDQRPTCNCPQSYSLVNPSDPHGNCKPDFEVSACDDGEQENINNPYRFETLNNTDWPLMDYSRKDNVQTEDDCKKLCSDDCFCAVVIFRANTCWKKKLPLSNGRSGGSGTGTAFLKVRNKTTLQQQLDLIPNHPPPKRGVMYALLGTSGFFNVVLLCLCGSVIYWFFYQRRPNPTRSFGVQQRRFNSSVMHFTYEELEEATDGFKEEIGRGACAIVYKGCWGTCEDGSNTKTLIAVKKIDRASLGEAEKELRMEVDIIGQTYHKNLVRMIGFCEEDGHRMLVYEFMTNGSLADYLFGGGGGINTPLPPPPPSWDARIGIVKGVAKGLCYLHHDCSTQIIHCDIKPHNILLDESYQPKISDFGLSKLLKLNQFHTHTAVRGTKGYLAPEWFRNKPVDVKVDVYSFGVLLLEIVSCRRCIDHNNIDHKGAVLTDFAISCYQSGDLAALVSADDAEAVQDMEKLESFVKVAIWCVQEIPKDRPTMWHVVQMLEGSVQVPAPPSPYYSSFSNITTV